MKWSNIEPNKRGHGLAVGEIFNGIYSNPNINRCLLFNVLGVAEETLNLKMVNTMSFTLLTI